MPATGKNQACFAWWIGGENQKAKVSVKNREETDDAYEALHRTWDTPAPRFLDNRDLDFLPSEIEEPARLVTLASLPLLGSSSQSAGMPYFYDVTTTSYTLPINVSMGGFKHDLCLLLNKENLKGTEFAARTDSDCPIVENSDLPQGSEPNMPIGSWQNLHAYYNCWPDGTANDGNNFTARLIGDLKKCHTRMSGSMVVKNNMSYVANPDDSQMSGGDTSYYDTRAMLEEGSTGSGYARTPVMLAFMTNFGLVTDKKEKQPFNPDKPEYIYDLRMCYAPMFLWWNPYNVPMRIRGQQLWAKSTPAQTAWMQTYAKGSTTNGGWGWSNYAMRELTEQEINQYKNSDLPGCPPDHGEFFQESISNQNGDIVFEPGEILFFSPGRARATTDLIEPFANPWVAGYQPSNVSSAKIRFYSNKSQKEMDDAVWYVRLRLGQTQHDGHPEAEDKITQGGYWFGPRRRECITVLNGFHSADKSGGDKDVSKGDEDGKWGCSPQRMLLGWYDPDENPNYEFVTQSSGTWVDDGTQSDPEVPYYVGAIGVVAKSANASIDTVLDPNDYRGKIWQHSSPAFWGGALTKPDPQMKKYHPYQLAALQVSGGMTSAPMDNLGRNGFLGITSEGEQVSFASVLELPVHPPFSLAGFAGMRLQPGWYQSANAGDFASVGLLRRMQYQSGVPGVGLGNAFADPCLPAEDVYTHFQSEMESSLLSSNARVFGDFYDHGLLINDAMWDRWFCSSVSDMPDKSGKIEARKVLSSFLSGREPLPVSRYKRVNTPYSDSQIIKRVMDNDGWKYIAQYLMIDGGFNVNSTSEEAWAAVLQGLAKRKLVTNKNESLTFVEGNKNENEVLFSRFMLSTTDKSVDGLGGYSMLQGSTNFRESGLASAWGEVRMLQPESIRKLAEEIVKQVRKRGPFLSMSDFVNRRLEAGENGLKGALQAAIDATDINRDFNEVSVPEARGEMFKNPAASMGSLHTAAPGYLIQSDVLASLGNILTVRDDTFTVRSYGCVRNPNKAILAQAWCEAVVQRTMDYVDPSNAPQDVEYNPDGTKGVRLTNTNKVMGRQFRIVSFKWLDNWDI